MGYQTIVDICRRVSKEVNPNGTFVHGRRIDGSIEYDGPFPQIHLYPFTTNSNRDTYTDTHNLLIGFWFQDAPDSTNEEREQIIADADQLCRDFLDELENEDVNTANIRTEPQYQTLHGTLSGYALQIQMIEPIPC